MSSGVDVFEAIRTLGFTPDNDRSLHARWDDGRIEIRAVDVPAPFVLTGGVRVFGWFRYPRTFGEIDFNLPYAMPSMDHLKAVLADNLSAAFDTDTGAAAAPQWFREGLALEHLCWELLYQSNPPPVKAIATCTVEREWLRLLLRKLLEAVVSADVAAAVRFSVSGSLLRLECGTGHPGGGQGTADRQILSQATGEDWPRAWSVRALDLRDLPKRLMRNPVPVEVFEDALRIGNQCYPLIPDSALSSDGLRVDCPCVGTVPTAAKEAILRGKAVASLVDHSHFWVDVRRCECCGQRFLTVFHEIVDWDNGDDDHTWLAVPVTGAEVRRLETLGHPVSEGDISAVEWSRRYLMDSVPSGCVWRSDSIWLSPFH